MMGRPVASLEACDSKGCDSRTDDLVESLRCAEASGASANDEHVNRAGILLV